MPIPSRDASVSPGLDGPGVNGSDAVSRRSTAPGASRSPLAGSVARTGADAVRERAGSAPGVDARPAGRPDRVRPSRVAPGPARVRTPIYPPDEAAIGPALDPVPSRPASRVGLGSPPGDGLDRSATGARGLGRIAGAIRDDAIALGRVGAAAGVEACRARFGASCAPRSAARRPEVAIEADGSSGHDGAPAARIARGRHRSRATAGGRC